MTGSRSALRFVSALLITLFVAAAPTHQSWAEDAKLAMSHGRAMLLPVNAEALTVEGSDARFSIEVAETPEARARGLMFRKTMPDDRGMLFVFPASGALSFWMQNTPMPLDLVFIGEDGIVVDVLPGEPFSTASIGPDGPSRFVLELKAGTAARSGIESGTRLHHPLIDADQGAN